MARRRRRSTTGSSTSARSPQIWRGGCIIRARFLQKITEAYDARARPREPAARSRTSSEQIQKAQANWRKVVALRGAGGVAGAGVHVGPGLLRRLPLGALPANLLQAQRDYFGAHTYERTDAPRGKFFHLDWPDPKRPQLEV